MERKTAEKILETIESVDVVLIFVLLGGISSANLFLVWFALVGYAISVIIWFVIIGKIKDEN